MVNKRVYNYLIKNSKKYNIEDLKKKLVTSGYDKSVVDEAVNAVKQQAQMPKQKQTQSQPAQTRAGLQNPKKQMAQKVQKQKPKVVQKTGTKQNKNVKTTKSVKPQKQAMKKSSKNVVQKNGKEQKNTNQKTGNQNAQPKKGKAWVVILIVVLAVLVLGAVAYLFFLR